MLDEVSLPTCEYEEQVVAALGAGHVSEELAAHRKASDTAIATASADGLDKSLTELKAALDLDPSSTLTFAEVAQTAALDHLLYAPAQPDTAAITKAINAAAQDITKPDQKDPGGKKTRAAARGAVGKKKKKARK